MRETRTWTPLGKYNSFTIKAKEGWLGVSITGETPGMRAPADARAIAYNLLEAADYAEKEN